MTAAVVETLTVERDRVARQLDALNTAIRVLTDIYGPPEMPPAPEPAASTDPARPVAAPEGPQPPTAPTVPDVKDRPAGPTGPVVIPPARPGTRRDFTPDQRRVLLDHLAEHGLTATSSKFEVARSVLLRMRRNASESQDTQDTGGPSIVAAVQASRAEDLIEDRDVDVVAQQLSRQARTHRSEPPVEPTVDIEPQNPDHRFVCSCRRRFPTAAAFGEHRKPVPEAKKKLHRLIEQPPVAIVGSRVPARRPGEDDQTWEARKRRAAGEAM